MDKQKRTENPKHKPWFPNETDNISVFVFNASLRAIVPASPIWFSFKNKTCFLNKTSDSLIQWLKYQRDGWFSMQCLFSTLHPMRQLLYLQCCLLIVFWTKRTWIAYQKPLCCEQTNETKMEESCVCFQCLTQCTCTTITNFVFYQIFHHKETNDLRNETHVSEQCPKECDWFSMHCSTGLLPNRQWDSLCFEQIEQSTLWKKQKETVIQNVPIRVPEEMCLFQVHLPTLQFLNAQRLNLCQTHCLVDENET